MGQKYEASLAFLVEYKFTPCPCYNHTLQVTTIQSSKAQVQSTIQAIHHIKSYKQDNACKHAKDCFIWKSGS